MKRLYQFLLLCFVILNITSCSTGFTAYKHGDYYNACLESIDRLRSKPNNKKAQYVLTTAYPLALKTTEREIDNANLANNADKYDVFVYNYQRMNKLADAIFASPKAYELIPKPVEYVAELSNAKQMAAEQSYNMGINALKIHTVDQARAAYQYFLKANDYVRGYKDVLNKIDDARYYATLRIVVQRPITSNRYQYSADFFYNNLLAEMKENAKNRFIRFYSPEEAKQERMQDPHHYLVLNFEDFTIGNIRETSNTVDLSRDSVVVGTVKIDGKTYNSYNTVKAKLTTLRREISSNGVLSIRFIDSQSGQEIQYKNFTGSYVWKTTRANYKGDDRAMNEEQKRMCTREPQIPPTDQDLFVEFTKPIYSQAASYVRSFYSKY
jgi:hypothetical protein